MKRVVMLAGAIALAVQAAPSMAQQGAERLAGARRHLRNVEIALRNIEAKGVITGETAKVFDGGLQAYAEGVFGAYNAVMADAELAAKSEGKEGNVEYMRAFEKELEVDHLRIQHVQEQVKVVQSGVQSGVILLDPALLEELSPEEMSGFASFLSKDALAKYRELYPHLKFPEWSLQSNVFPRVGAFAKNVYSQACALPGRIDRALMPPVDAAIAWPCVGPCWAKNWGSCALCVITAVPSGVQAWNSFVSCWNGSGKPWWVVDWLWKVGCVGAFVARLA